MKTVNLPSVILRPLTGFVHRRSEIWELIAEGPQVEGTPTLEFLGFLWEGETYISGELALARSKEMDGSESGEQHLGRLLAQADSIPTEFRSYQLVATGTKLGYPGSGTFLPGLRWDGGKWAWYYIKVEHDHWGGSIRLVRVRQ